MNTLISTTQFGDLLRHWRSTRRLSQLDLALQSDTSARHLSFIETGRAQPSREMVTRLADVLNIPLRDRNALLMAAGYAPHYRHTDLETTDMTLVRRAVDFMLQHQEPYPCIVHDRHWNLVRANKSASTLMTMLLRGKVPDANILRLICRPDGLRSLMPNWEEVAGDLLRRVQQQLAWSPGDATLQQLLSEVLAYPGVPAHWQTRALQAPTPLLTIILRLPEYELRFFSTLTTFGTPQDITLEELHIESSFPADDVTERACRAFA